MLWFMAKTGERSDPDVAHSYATSDVYPSLTIPHVYITVARSLSVAYLGRYLPFDILVLACI